MQSCHSNILFIHQNYEVFTMSNIPNGQKDEIDHGLNAITGSLGFSPVKETFLFAYLLSFLYYKQLEKGTFFFLFACPIE